MQIDDGDPALSSSRLVCEKKGIYGEKGEAPRGEPDARRTVVCDHANLAERVV